MDRLNHVNIKQEEHDGQKEILINNAQQQQNNEGHDASSYQLSVRAPKHVKKEEEGEDGIVKQVQQSCTKVKKEEEGDGECIKLEWDGDECDCEECRVDRQIKVEFNLTNNQQQANSYPGHSNAKKGVPSQISVCKRVKKEEEEEGDDQWDEDCDCDDCRRMRLKAIRLKQNNDMVNQGGDDGEETEIDEDWNGNEDVLVGNDANMAVDDQIGDEDGDEFNQEGEQSGDAQESSEDQMSDVDDETEIDDEEYEMEVGGEDSQTVEDAPIETTLPHCNGQTRKIVSQSARHSKRKQIDDSSTTECTTNQIQPNLVQSNRRFQCSHCHKSFDLKYRFERHLRVHTGERPFQCDQCDKRFKAKCNLTTHKLTHQNIKLFQCDQCDKKFSLKGNLIQHQLTHRNIKRFRCPECDKQFTRKYHLDSHLRKHSGERPFECRHCDLSFTDLCTRNTHEQAIHLHVKPYRCKQCGHTATHRSTIIQHIRVVHFSLPATIKQQRELNIIDDRDARELLEKV